MKQIWERILDLFPGKKAETARYVLLAVAGGILFLWSGDLFGLVSVREVTPPTTVAPVAAPLSKDELTLLEEQEAQKLERILSRVSGAGKVEVSVSIESGPELQLAMDTVQERTKQSEVAEDKSTRETETVSTRDTVVLQKGGSADVPVIAKRSRPVIAGVMVVAEGAWKAEVRQQLMQAVSTNLGISANRVSVFAAGRGGQ